MTGRGTGTDTGTGTGTDTLTGTGTGTLTGTGTHTGTRTGTGTRFEINCIVYYCNVYQSTGRRPVCRMGS